MIKLMHTAWRTLPGRRCSYTAIARQVTAPHCRTKRQNWLNLLDELHWMQWLRRQARWLWPLSQRFCSAISSCSRERLRCVGAAHHSLSYVPRIIAYLLHRFLQWVCASWWAAHVSWSWHTLLLQDHHSDAESQVQGADTDGAHTSAAHTADSSTGWAACDGGNQWGTGAHESLSREAWNKRAGNLLASPQGDKLPANLCSNPLTFLPLPQNVTARRAPKFYRISNKRGFVGRFCLFKPAYKLGEDIVGSLDFGNCQVRCVQFSVKLQQQELPIRPQAEQQQTLAGDDASSVNSFDMASIASGIAVDNMHRSETSGSARNKEEPSPSGKLTTISTSHQVR